MFQVCSVLFRKRDCYILQIWILKNPDITVAEKFTNSEIAGLLESLPGWEYADSSIRKTFKTRSYPATMGFVAAVGGFCQKHNHHPDYVLMKYREVEVSFSTHSAGGVTSKDIDIAKDIETIPL